MASSVLSDSTGQPFKNAFENRECTRCLNTVYRGTLPARAWCSGKCVRLASGWSRVRTRSRICFCRITLQCSEMSSNLGVADKPWSSGRVPDKRCMCATAYGVSLCGVLGGWCGSTGWKDNHWIICNGIDCDIINSIQFYFWKRRLSVHFKLFYCDVFV